MPRNHQKEVKQAALYAIIVPIFIVIWAILNPSLFFPTIAYWIALATVCLGLWLFGFASYNFGIVLRNQRDVISNGVATIRTTFYKDGRPSDFAVLIPTMGNALVNPYDLPSKSRFFGRWTVYTLESQRLEIWHDKYVFGSYWYYIQY